MQDAVGKGRMATISTEGFDAVIFDMDGVVTRTATLHAAAWKELFDAFLRARSDAPNTFRPFDDVDYRRYVDGRPRYDGVAGFLASRGMSLPFGSPDDPPYLETVCGLGNRKNLIFHELMKRHGVDVFPSTVDLLRRLRAAGLKTGVFSASRNAEAVLTSANLLALFDGKIDGRDAQELGLPGKPDPATLLELARRLGTQPARTIVIEDAIAGVQAGSNGGFGLVIGVDRSGASGLLLQNGADVEVKDLREVALSTEEETRSRDGEGEI